MVGRAPFGPGNKSPLRRRVEAAGLSGDDYRTLCLLAFVNVNHTARTMPPVQTGLSG